MTTRAPNSLTTPAILVAEDWRDYRLLDSGKGGKPLLLVHLGHYR